MLGLSDATNTRLVPISDTDAMVIDYYRRRAESSADRMILDSILRRMDAAPANPAEAVWTALRRHDYTTDVATLRDAVLIALRYSAREANGGQS